jgi:hypothetical protein
MFFAPERGNMNLDLQNDLSEEPGLTFIRRTLLKFDDTVIYLTNVLVYTYTYFLPVIKEG